MSGDLWLGREASTRIKDFRVADHAVPLSDPGRALYREWQLQGRPGAAAEIDAEIARYAAAPALQHAMTRSARRILILFHADARPDRVHEYRIVHCVPQWRAAGFDVAMQFGLATAPRRRHRHPADRSERHAELTTSVHSPRIHASSIGG